MLRIINPSTDPYYNLALEEYCLKQATTQGNILILWQNESTIVIGKHQNAYEELNLDFTREHHIHVARRLSGGGAVYHDLGNINFTIILQNGAAYKNDFGFFAVPIIRCLSHFGVSAQFNGRNDLLIEGKKFSGNAQYFYRDRVLHHGTLLYASDLTVLSNALRVNASKMVSKGIQSARSRVTNISEHMKNVLPLHEFSETLADYLLEGEKSQKDVTYELQPFEQQEILKLREEKYATWQWNFGRSPKMNFVKERKFEAGVISILMEITAGTIRRAKLSGDFFEVNPVDLFVPHLVGIRLDWAEVSAVLKRYPISNYIFAMTNAEFLDLLFN